VAGKAVGVTDKGRQWRGKSHWQWQEPGWLTRDRCVCSVDLEISFIFPNGMKVKHV
jgi:hypothetical protein